MTKALVITKHFPPSNEVGGFRAEAWYKYFFEFDIECFVFTESPGEEKVNVRRFNDKAVRSSKTSMLTELKEAFVITKVRLTPFYQQFLAYVNDVQPDLIIATGPPFSLFKITSLVANDCKIPWVADYRDGWSNNVSYVKSLKGTVKKRVWQLIERRYVKSASLITTASPVYSSNLRMVFPNKRIESIYNGFFEEDFQDLPLILTEGPLEVTYLGTLYSFQKVEIFLEGVKSFISKSGTGLISNFVGVKKQPNASQRLIAYDKGLSAHLKLTDKIPRKDALRIAGSSDALLLICNPEVPQLYAKVFDYVALCKPIIVVNAEAFMREFLKDVPMVYYCSNAADVTLALEEIIARQQEAKDQNLTEQLRLESLTRRYQTGQMASKLEAILNV